MPNTLPRNPAYTFFGEGYPCRHHKKFNKNCKPYEKWDTSYCDFETLHYPRRDQGWSDRTQRRRSACAVRDICDAE